MIKFPIYTKLIFLFGVNVGRGIQGAVFPGCPETFQSSGNSSQDQRESSEDQHQKVRQVREGDVVALPSGVADWFYNNGDSPLVLVQLLDTSNPANQLDQDFRVRITKIQACDVIEQANKDYFISKR
jgi:hypothetical protein